MQEVWYHKSFKLNNNWKDKKIFIHFGGVDYKCDVFVNKIKVGSNIGVQAPFSIEISKAVNFTKNNDIIVYVIDE